MRSIATGLTSLLCLGRVQAEWQAPAEHHQKALELMDKAPLIDTHVDLPQIIRSLGK